MRRPLVRRLLLLVLAVCGVLTGWLGAPSPAAAHNSLVSSDPADGTALPTPPTAITWVFSDAVPLETMTVTLIDATGARSELVGSTHGAEGESVVVTPLPGLQPGPFSVRWRLVSPDGHAVTGRVGLTIAAPTETSVAAVAPLDTATTVPAEAAPITADAAGDDDGASTPSAVRWAFRVGSYVAIMAVVGILLTGRWVWPGAPRDPVLMRLLGRSLAAVAVLGAAQLLVLASDIDGRSPWSSFGSIDAAMTTDAGRALVVRMVLAGAMWLVIFRASLSQRDVYWTAVTLAGVGLLGTWAFAGHARSMRWPTLGVVTSVVHHAAAAVWIVGLAIVAGLLLPRADRDVVVPAVRRFSRLAATSVVVLVVTGVVQSARLVGNPLDLLDADHGRYLAAKLVALAVMLGLAAANRQRVARGLDAAGSPASFGTLRRAVGAEFALGVVIIAITAAMVVSPPTAGAAAPKPPDRGTLDTSAG